MVIFFCYPTFSFLGLFSFRFLLVAFFFFVFFLTYSYMCALRAIPRTDSETPKEKEPHLFNDVVAIDTFLRHRFKDSSLLFSVGKQKRAEK